MDKDKAIKIYGTEQALGANEAPEKVVTVDDLSLTLRADKESVMEKEDLSDLMYWDDDDDSWDPVD